MMKKKTRTTFCVVRDVQFGTGQTLIGVPLCRELNSVWQVKKAKARIIHRQPDAYIIKRTHFF